METLPCASEVVQLQAHQPHQQPPTQLVNRSQPPMPLNESQQLENLSNMDSSLGESVVTISKELILISLVSQEQALYNPKHQHYRSTQHKDEKWNEIGNHVGWTDSQCKAKWKAMRDQYCRELKRAKASAKSNVKWKYFKELDFLRPYALARNYRTRTPNINGNVSTPVSLPNNNTTLNNSFSSNSSSQTISLSADHNKFGNIKIEHPSASILNNCSFVPSTTTNLATAVTTANVADKKTVSTRLLSAFISGQMSDSMQQQQQPQSQQDNNWNYLTDASANGVSVSSTITVTRETPSTTADDTLYNEFVDCVTAAANQSTQQQSATAEEEDDDPIHTFLNLESYFEKTLITLIQQEDMIYNYSNQNYRNVKMKMEVWNDIARKLKKPVKQCRQKWKALRDQYAREHKRLKTMINLDAHSRWKHYDSLNFLQKFIQQKSFEGDAQLSMILPKHEPVSELEEHMAAGSPLHSEPQQTMAASPASAQLSMPTLPPLTGPHKAELSAALEHSPTDDLCVSSYDEMDIENFINGDVTRDDEDDDEDEDMETSTNAEQQQQHVVNYRNDDEHVYIAVQNVGNTLPSAATSVKPPTATEQLNEVSNLQHHHQQQMQQQQQMETAASAAAVAAAVDYQQKIDAHTPTSTTPRYNSSGTPTTSHSAYSANPNDEDEIGAFFKAVAIKIRSAQLEPVAFTDLQINILRVINDALHHH